MAKKRNIKAELEAAFEQGYSYSTKREAGLQRQKAALIEAAEEIKNMRVVTIVTSRGIVTVTFSLASMELVELNRKRHRQLYPNSGNRTGRTK